MQAITNPIALELSNEVRKTVSSNDFVNDTLNRKNELEQLRDFILQQTQKTAKITAEKMLISAIRNFAPQEVIEAMRKSAGITETRLFELMQQAKKT